MVIFRKFVFAFMVSLLFSLNVSACSTNSQQKLHMMPMDNMPMEVRSASMHVQQAYQFGAANPDILGDIPCYCGCESIGHESNYDCYVADVESSGMIIYDTHAVTCSICVDITQDVMSMIRDGRSTQDARAYIIAEYSKYAP